MIPDIEFGNKVKFQTPYQEAARDDKEKKEMIFKLKRTHEKQEKAHEVEQFYQNMIRAGPPVRGL